MLARFVILAVLMGGASGAGAQGIGIGASVEGSAQAGADPAASGQVGSVDTGSCVPACREGYVCHQGQCLSACNPPCGPGMTCTSAGQCVSQAQPAPAYQPAPTYQPAPAQQPFPQVPPSEADQPPPPGSWEPEYDSRQRGEYHFRPFVGLTMNVGGESSDFGPLYDDNFFDDYNYSLDFSAGLEGGIEFRFSRIFGLAPAFRIYSFGTDGAFDSNGLSRDYTTGVFDILVQPTFHIPIGMVEVLIPLSVGAEFTSGPANDESGTGLTFGVTPGVAIWALPFLGFHAQFGFALHYIGYDEYDTVAYRYLLNTGVDFAF